MKTVGAGLVPARLKLRTNVKGLPTPVYRHRGTDERVGASPTPT